LTRYRDALQFFSASYEKPPGPVRYPGLKIFTPLTLRFQDFQRMESLWGSLKCRQLDCLLLFTLIDTIY
jgi:hypothetical protein